MNEDSGREEEEQERPRPRVVDKRVSSRAAAPPPSDPAPVVEPRPSEPPPQAEPPRQPPAPSPEEPPGEQVWTPEREEQARRIAEEIARAPASDLVVTMAMNFVEVATVKLDAGDLAGAQLAIDAFNGVVRELGARLGDAEAPLKNVLAQMQMAYAQRAAQPPAAP